MADYLLIDISNSFTKLAPSTKEKIGKIARIPTGAVSPATLEHATRAWNFDTAVVSSVVPEKAKVLARFLKGKRVINVGPQTSLGVGIEYPNPKSIGPDRLANAACSVALYGTPVVVVDFGTAVTFDIISQDRKYIGGVIAPGLEVMTDYLYQRTALLPKINLLEPVSAVGKSTRDAMMAGAVFGYRGLVKEILIQIKRELGVPKGLKVVTTGGYADLIAAKLPELRKVHPTLTIEGLRIIGNLNS